MDRTETFRRCAVFTAGVLVCAVGVAEDLMVPEDISNVIVFLASPMAHGVSGNIMFVDGGTDALLNSEKVY